MREVVFAHDYLESGWMRWLPHSAFFIHMAIATLDYHELPGDPDDQPLGGSFANVMNSIGGLHGDPLASEEEELRSDDADDEVRARFEETKQRLERACAATDIHVSTNRDVLELMRRLGLVRRELADGIQWRVTNPLPLPGERIPLLPDESAEEDRIRWEGLHDRTAQTIIRRFVDDDLDSLLTTVAQLAEDLALPTESIRHGLLNLLNNGDFSTDTDVATVGDSQPFVLTVDWVLFDDSRIGISIGESAGD